MKVWIIAAATVAVLVGALLVGPRLVSDRAAAPAEPETTAAEPALSVEVATVTPRFLAERLSTTGTVRANEQVDLVSEIAGIVESVNFEEGSRVERGQLLVELVDDELQAQRDRVRSRVRLAETREARQRELKEQGIVSEQEYDVASSELDVLRAELRLMQAQLEKTAIHAPFDGVIGLRYVSQGSLVTPQTRIATLQDLDPAKIDFTLPEKYAGLVGPGARVEFAVKGTARRRTAEVYAVEPRIDAETRSLVFRARTPNPNGALLPGAFADVTVTVGGASGALVVPSLAVVPELGGKKVFVVEDGLAQPRRVETGIRTDTEVEITSGLAPGDRVIVSGIQRLRPGLAVSVSDVVAEGDLAEEAP